MTTTTHKPTLPEIPVFSGSDDFDAYLDGQDVFSCTMERLSELMVVEAFDDFTRGYLEGVYATREMIAQIHELAGVRT
jgi:hypothetical protein